jgi:tetratricopeptide (TPR) repeat protein
MRLAPWIALVLLALAPSAAWAQAPASQAARAHFNRGMDHYKAGDYDAAVAEIEAAIAIVDEPDFDYLLGQAERRRGRCDRAIDAYRRFLKSGPPPAEVKVAETNILRCEEAIAKARPPPVDDGGLTRPPAPPPSVPPVAPAAPPTPVPAPAVPPTFVPAPPPPIRPSPGSATGKVAGAVTAGLGAVALGIGAYLAVDAGNRARSVNAAAASHAMWTQALQDDFDSAHREGLAAAVLLGVGGALVAAGGLVIVLNVRPKGAPPNGRVSIRAGVDPGGRIVAIVRF